MEAPPRFELGIRVLQTHAYHLAIAPLLLLLQNANIFAKIKALPPLLQGLWSGLRGSNSLPPPWQGGALPDELNPRINFMPTALNTIRKGTVSTVYGKLLYVILRTGDTNDRFHQTLNSEAETFYLTVHPRRRNGDCRGETADAARKR